MADHTKGPWRVEEGATSVWGACNPDDNSSRGMGYPITDCRVTPAGQWARGPEVDEGIANARLIAAAPDLYNSLDPDTLETIADEIDCFAHSARASSLRGIAKRQRSAIAKVTGA